MTGIDEPLYTVQLDIAGAAADVRCNDAPIFQEQHGYNTVTELTLNRWIRNGANSISLTLGPGDGERQVALGARGSAVVYVRAFPAERESRREVARVSYPAIADRAGNRLRVEGAFDAAVPYDSLLWLGSETIVPDERTAGELTLELSRFHDWLAGGDLESIVGAMSVRDREDAAAIYQTLDQQVSNTRRTYAVFINDADAELRPLAADRAMLRVYGQGRLARFELSNGRSPVYFHLRSMDMAAYMPVFFCRHEGRWLFIR
jgi:hypothetical protein